MVRTGEVQPMVRIVGMVMMKPPIKIFTVRYTTGMQLLIVEDYVRVAGMSLRMMNGRHLKCI